MTKKWDKEFSMCDIHTHRKKVRKTENLIGVASVYAYRCVYTYINTNVCETCKHPLTSGILTCMQNTHTHTKKFTLIHRTSESVSGRVGKFFAGGGVGGDGLLGEAGDLGRTGSERENGL